MKIEYVANFDESPMSFSGFEQDVLARQKEASGEESVSSTAPSVSSTPVKRKLTQPSLNQWLKKPKDC